jgi:rhodanese-related sulfurtransferase
MSPLRILKAIFTAAPRQSPSECAARIRSGEALLIDVREPSEWTDGVAQHAALLPLSDLNGPRTHWQPFLAKVGGRELLIYCAVGGRAGMAAKLLASEGFKAGNTGGLSNWGGAGWTIVQPVKTRAAAQ